MTDEAMDEGAYELACRSWLQQVAAQNLAVWLDVGNVLRGRPNWRVEVEPNGPVLWCFGLEGAARLVVTAKDGRVHLYDADADADVRVVYGPDDLESWLEANEHRYEGLTALQRELAADLIRRGLEELQTDD